MPDNPQQKIDKPAGTETVPETNAGGHAVFVMPERYRGGKEQMVEAKPKEPPKKPVAPAPPAPPPVAKPAAIPPSVKNPPVKRKRGLGVLLLVGILLVGGLAIGGFLVLRDREEPPAPTTPTPTTPTPTTPTPTTPEPTEPTPSAPRPGLDSDTDGLTDTEERLMYRTDPLIPDTDADGYPDGTEVFNAYNPGGTAPETLRESGLVLAFDGARYVILYPSVWSAQADSTDANTLVLTATTGETVRVTIEPKASSETLSQWHSARHPEEDVIAIVTRNGYDSLVVPGQLTQYVAEIDAVLTIQYDAGTRNTIEYLQTFRMMTNNLLWKE